MGCPCTIKRILSDGETRAIKSFLSMRSKSSLPFSKLALLDNQQVYSKCDYFCSFGYDSYCACEEKIREFEEQQQLQ